MLMRFALVLGVVVALVGAVGCNNRLTPDQVRDQLDHPKGTVSKDTMARITGDLFQAGHATSVEGLANLLKTNQSAPSGANAIPGVQAGVLEDTGDAFCVGGLVASIATFDGCKEGKDCHGDLTIDSCVLRIGDPGADEAAQGKIEFKVDSTHTAGEDKTDLTLQFDGWEQTDGDAAKLDSVDG
ncbi:MAG TPA: hypothetical protein VGO62_05790, partial [Myxococcota bacterium]